MLLHSMIVSPGCFAQWGRWPLIGVLLGLLLLAPLSLALLP